MRKGFTLVEMLLAVGLLAVVTALTFLTFTTVSRAWKKGTDMADGIHHGDFVLDNLSMALRSAYYPDGGGKGYGFFLEDSGETVDDILMLHIGHGCHHVRTLPHLVVTVGTRLRPFPLQTLL